MKTEYLILGAAVIGVYLIYSRSGGTNSQNIRYIQGYQGQYGQTPTGITSGDVGAAGSQLQAAGVNAASAVANAGLNKITNGLLSWINGPTETNVTSPTGYGYTSS